MQFLLGVLLGLLVASLLIWNPWTEHGVLRIDISNPGKDLYRFEIDRLDRLARKKRVILKIDSRANLSQK